MNAVEPLLQNLSRLVAILAIAALITSCAAPLRLNQIQLIGTHNSYKQAIDPDLLTQIQAENPALAFSLDYHHLPLTEQLAIGVRKFELDVFYDPEGGRYQNPGGLRLIAAATPYDTRSLALPGFKVMHIQDIDFRSHCLLLQDCLSELLEFSRQNPRHMPIFITVNAKDGVIDLPDFVRPLSFDALAWNQLDEVFRVALKEKLLTPDEVRGDYESLPEAISHGWPLLDEMRGRFVVVLDHQGDKLRDYIADHPALRGRAMFVNSDEGTPEAAIRVINDPIADQEKITGLVEAGYIVRTRSDADTVEAKKANTDRRDEAFKSGAQIVSTDYVTPFGNGYIVRFPSGEFVRCNPLLTKKGCRVEE